MTNDTRPLDAHSHTLHGYNLIRYKVTTRMAALIFSVFFFFSEMLECSRGTYNDGKGFKCTGRSLLIVYFCCVRSLEFFPFDSH